MVTCLVVDCLFITLSIIFGLISLKTTEQLREQLDEDEARRVLLKVLRQSISILW